MHNNLVFRRAGHIGQPLPKSVNTVVNIFLRISTFGNDKNRVSVILAIAGDGTKLPPLMIFKGEQGKITEKKLKEAEEVKQKKFIFAVNKIPGQFLILSLNGLMVYLRHMNY